MTSIAKKDDNDTLIMEFANTFLKPQGLTQNEIKNFIEIAKGFKLNPFKREIYAVKFGSKCNILVGYEVYLKRAERSGKLDGWQVVESGAKDTLKATITIYRKDWSKPFIHEVYFNEYCQQTQIWRQKPKTMLKKVAMSQGFRLAFPEDLGGMPYSEEEMPSNDKDEGSIDKLFAADTMIRTAVYKEDFELLDAKLKLLALTGGQKKSIAPLYIKHKASAKYKDAENDPSYQKFAKEVDEVIDADK